MELNIMTWNIDWFRNGTHTKGGNYYLESDVCYASLKNIANTIKDFLKKPNSVVFLQEVPNNIKTDVKWVDAECSVKFFEEFKDDKYIINKNTQFCTRYTLAISKSSDTQIENYKKDYRPKGNRTIAMEFNDISSTNITMLAVHMPTGFTSGDINSKMWDELIYFTKNVKTPLILVGDFNAYKGCKVKETKIKYEELLKDVKDILQPEEITFVGNTLIDHVLVKNCELYSIETNIPDKFEYSDHKYIEIKIKSL